MLIAHGLSASLALPLMIPARSVCGRGEEGAWGEEEYLRVCVWCVCVSVELHFIFLVRGRRKPDKSKND